jgi:hypothetical protein
MEDILAGSIVITALSVVLIVGAVLLLRPSGLIRERDEAKRALLKEQRRRERGEHLLSTLYTEARSRADSGDQVAVYFVDLIQNETSKMDGVIIDR